MKTLAAGIGLGGATIGYMTAGSATPVVGAVITALLTAIATLATLLVKGSDEAKLIALIVKREPLDEPTKEAVRLLAGKQPIPIAKIGVLLLVFFGCYWVGSLTGTMARTHRWFAPSRVLADIRKVKQPTVGETLLRLRIAQQLLDNGYKEDIVYDLMVAPLMPVLSSRSERNGEPEVKSARIDEATSNRRMASEQPDAKAPIVPKAEVSSVRDAGIENVSERSAVPSGNESLNPLIQQVLQSAVQTPEEARRLYEEGFGAYSPYLTEPRPATSKDLGAGRRESGPKDMPK